jgi:hypothetical protein
MAQAIINVGRIEAAAARFLYRHIDSATQLPTDLREMMLRHVSTTSLPHN